MSANPSARPLSRRLFMFRGAAGAATAAIVAGPAVAAVQANAPAENPTLLTIGTKLTKAEAVFDETDARKAEARALYERIQPEIPADLTLPSGQTRWGIVRGEQERDIDDKAVWPPVEPGKYRAARYQLPSYALDLAIPEIDGRSVVGRAMRRLRKVAVRYEQAVEDAKALVGWREIDAADYYARRDIRVLTEEAFAIPALTAEGLCIKARCLVAQKRAREDYRGGLASHFGEDLAAEIATLLGGRA